MKPNFDPAQYQLVVIAAFPILFLLFLWLIAHISFEAHYWFYMLYENDWSRRVFIGTLVATLYWATQHKGLYGYSPLWLLASGFLSIWLFFNIIGADLLVPPFTNSLPVISLHDQNSVV